MMYGPEATIIGQAMDWVTTSTILRDLASDQSDAAWLRLTERFRDPIVRFARRLGLTACDAEDVAQETLTAFVCAYRQGRYERSKGRLSRWLLGFAYRQAQSARRSSARRRLVEGDPAGGSFWADVPDPSAGGPARWDREWEDALLEQCLRQVRQEVEPRTMRAFELVMRPGAAAASVADELGVPVKAVYNAKYSVLRRLRDLRRQLDDLD
jgi:RNA polymerase sigma-70 factor (ECF subfamily)